MKFIALFTAISIFFCTLPALAMFCGIAATPVAFGSYNVANPSQTLGSGSITITCNAAYVHDVTLTASSGSYVHPRYMKFGANSLTYDISTVGYGGQSLGDGTAGSQMWVGYGSETVPMYGTIPASQNLPTGTYSDLIYAHVIW